MGQQARLNLRRRNAYHESGHAVLAVALGMPLVKVDLDAGLTTYGDGEDPGKVNAQSGLLDVRHAIVGAAGPVAAGIAMGEEPKWRPGDPDFYEAHVSLFAVLADSDADLAEAGGLRLVGVLSGIAGDLLRRRWSKVEAVARLLLERGTISGDEVRAIVGAPEQTCLAAELAGAA